MKKLFTLFLILATLCCSILLVGCADSKKDLTIQEDFAEYHSSINVEDSKYLFLKTGSNSKIWNISFEKEDGTYPKVVSKWEFDFAYNTHVEYEKQKYDFSKQSPTKIKAELKSIGDKVVEYAKARNWKNDYYLFIAIEVEYNFDFVYNYETDKLYIPKQLSTYLKMYEQFSTFSQSEIAKKQGGVDWLVSNGLGEIKHGEYSSKTNALQSYSVWISQGKLVTTEAKLSEVY